MRHEIVVTRPAPRHSRHAGATHRPSPAPGGTAYPQQQPQPQRQVVKRGANDGLHLFLSLITCGLWTVTGWPITVAMGHKTVTTSYAPQPQQYPPTGCPSQQAGA
jgi:hypothetical protein